jgi:uncharacterized protein (DUF433 family)
MQSEYIEPRHGGYYVAGTRISLDSVVYSFNEGQSPEAIQEDFPSLKRAQVYGAIAFYLDHQAEIDKYLEGTEREFEGSATPIGAGKPNPGGPKRATFLRSASKLITTSSSESSRPSGNEMDRAAAQGRVLVSHDRRTMIDHLRNRLAVGKSRPG